MSVPSGPLPSDQCHLLKLSFVPSNSPTFGKRLHIFKEKTSKNKKSNMTSQVSVPRSPLDSDAIFPLLTLSDQQKLLFSRDVFRTLSKI